MKKEARVKQGVGSLYIAQKTRDDRSITRQENDTIWGGKFWLR